MTDEFKPETLEEATQVLGSQAKVVEAGAALIKAGDDLIEHLKGRVELLQREITTRDRRLETLTREFEALTREAGWRARMNEELMAKQIAMADLVEKEVAAHRQVRQALQLAAERMVPQFRALGFSQDEANKVTKEYLDPVANVVDEALTALGARPPRG